MKKLLLLVLVFLLCIPPASANFFGGMLATPVSVLNGGTGSTTANGALTNLGIPAVLPARLARVSVPLTAAGQTALYTVTTGKTLYVTDVFVEGQTAITGAVKTATVTIGTSGNSYSELLTVAGYSFVTATAATLLAVGSAVRGTDLIAVASASVARVRVFASGTTLQVNVAGVAPPTGGAVYVELWGYEQ